MSDPSADSSSTHHPAPGAGDDLEFPSLEELAALLPQYEMHEIVGVGGMGAVYRARQVSLDRWVAIKVLPASSAQRQEDVQRFIKEARAMARLVHPHIVAVFDFGQTTAGHLFLVMEFIEGTDLHRLTRSGGVTLERARRIVGELCEALQFAHDRGVAHRDIKPANILITSDLHVKVADFGLAREASAHTVADEIEYGTPDYTAPERLIIGATVDHRADIFSLGVVMHEMLTGKTPTAAGADACKGLPEGFAAVIQKCIQSDPEARYQKAAEVRAALSPSGQSRATAPVDRPAATADFLPQPPVSHAQVRPPQIHEEPPELYTRYRPSVLAKIGRHLSPIGWGIACVLLVIGFAWIILKDRISLEMPDAGTASQEAPTPPAMPDPPAMQPEPTTPTPPVAQTAGADTPAKPAPAPAPAPSAAGATVIRRAAEAAPIPLTGPIGEAARLPGHKGPVYGVQLLDGGLRAVSVSTDKTLRIWDLAGRKAEQMIDPGIDQMVRLQVTADEKLALAYGFTADKVALVDLQARKVLHTASFPNERLVAAVYLPQQGQVLAGGSTEDGSGNLFTWKPGAEASFQPVEGFTGRVYAMALTPDGGSALVTSSRQTDPAKRLFRPAITLVDGATRAMRELPPGQLGYITRFMGPAGAPTSFVLGGTPKLLRLPGLEVAASLPPVASGQPTPLAGMAVDGGRLLLTSWSDATLRLHECATAEELWRHETAQAVTDIAMGPGERWALFACRARDLRSPGPGDNDLVLWRLPPWGGFMGKEALRARLRVQMADLGKFDPELAALLKQLQELSPPPSREALDQQRQTLDTQYLAALRRDLPFAAPRDQLAFRAEMERVTRHEELPESDPSLIPALRKLRGIYTQQLSLLKRQHEDAAAACRKAAEEALAPLQTRREKAGDQLGAMRAKSLLEKLREG